MKKTDIALILGVIVVIIISIFAFSSNSNKIEKPILLEDDFTGLKQIKYSEYSDLVENDSKFILLIEREGCSYCEAFEPIIEETTLEKEIPVYKVDIAEFSDDDINNFYESNRFLKKGDWGTPTTLVLQGDQVIDTLEGYVEKDELVEFLDENVEVAKASE